MTKPSMTRAQFLSEREALHKRALDRVQWSERPAVFSDLRTGTEIRIQVPGTPTARLGYCTDKPPNRVREDRMDAIGILLRHVLNAAEKQCGLSDADLALLTS